MNTSLLENILRCPRLPSLPAAAIKVVELCRRDDVTMRQLGSAIATDPALTAKILRTINSGYHSLSHRVTTVEHALVLLGLNAVKTLALGFSLVKALKDDKDNIYDPTPIWQHSLYSAIAARTIAQTVGTVDPEEVFLGGLLQDIGCLAMIQAIGSPYVTLLRRTDEEGVALHQQEQQTLQLDHTHVGAGLAELWKLPPVLTNPIRFHEEPELCPTQDRAMVYAVALGGFVARTLLRASSGSEGVEQSAKGDVSGYLDRATAWLSMDRSIAVEILRRTGEAAPELGRNFEIPEMASVDLSVILAEANELISELSWRNQRETVQLQQQATHLQELADHDGLTGLANRRRFDLEMARACTATSSRPFSLIMLDVDRFKAINDAHGHVVGDQVLAQLGKILAETAPEGALVARYGGEEFALLLPGCSCEMAAGLAESLRASIEAHRVEIATGESLRFTASFGVAARTSAPAMTAVQLVQAADEALYAAKRGGRNAVVAAGPKAA